MAGKFFAERVDKMQNRAIINQTRPDRYDSSFFHESYSGRKVLILVPHQDDEINTAGNAIQIFTRAGADVYVMFANSGDYYSHYNFDVRMTEAVNSLKVLGVERSHVFILGYGETLNNSESGHIFYTADNPIKSASGHTETYGAIGLQDFGFTEHGVHSAYCRNSYIRDLRELILKVKADIIIATDFDVHSDHRMLSLSFDIAMGEILSRPGNDYFPEVFRRFAYCTGYFAVPDLFSSDFILSTAKPQPGTLRGYDRKIIDTSYYSWPERVRFPVPEESREPYERNIITKALKQHVSQNAHIHAENIINSDEVSWRRRTDSITFSADVTASSGNPGYVHDFRLLNVANVDADSPSWENYLWIPSENDEAKELVFTWKSPQKISVIKLWGNVDGIPLQRVLITTNSGYESEFGPLPENGLPMTINLPGESQATECRVKIISQGSKESGLAEVEIFSENQQPPVVKPFIQITTGGNFVYVYPRKHEELVIPVEFYSYRIDSPISCKVEGPASFDGKSLTFESGKNDDVILSAYTEGGLFCKSVFHAVSGEEISAVRKRNSRDKRNIRTAAFIFRNKSRIKIYGEMLKRHGIIYLIKTLTEKIIRKVKKKIYR